MTADDPTRGNPQQIMDSIRRIVGALHVSSRDAERRLGISGAQLFVLRSLDRDSAASLNELAGRTLTHQSSVSVVVSRLVERGLVQRSVSRADARRVELTLSAKGRTFLERAPETSQERLVRAIGGLPPRQQARLRDLLRAVVKGAGISGETPELFFEGETDFEGGARSAGAPAPRGARGRK